MDILVGILIGAGIVVIGGFAYFVYYILKNPFLG